MQHTGYIFNKKNILLSFFLVFIFDASAQFVFRENNIPEKQSVYKFAEVADAGQKDFNITQVINKTAQLDFVKVQGENTNIGFTKNHYWIKLALKNETAQALTYYFETARPVTDLVHLYTVDEIGKIRQYKSGDAMPFDERSFSNRKPIFKLNILPNQKLQLYVHLKSDGEVINVPLLLRSENSFLENSTLEQLVFGIFYGILVIASLIYFFFFFGLKEKSFLYYSSYVLFIGLMQFSLDGYFYQYFTLDAGWFSNRSVIIFAMFSTFFLGKYAQEFLRIRLYNKFIYNAFNALYVAVAVLFLAVLIFPQALEFSYPLANILGLIVLVLIITSVITLYVKKGPIDAFFTTGVACLIVGFVIFIMNNFSLLPNTFFTENSSKFGTGLEVIFLSLSMANFIRNLKNEREELNRLALIRAEEMSELKSYLLSNISHELRTPLNAIMNLIDSISREIKDEKIRDNCQVIKYSSHSLLSSINDILDFSKIQKNELKLEPVNFNPIEVLEKIKNNAQIKAQENGLDFQYTISDNVPAILLGDVTRFSQIVNNVLNNAIKFTSQGQIKFNVYADENSRDVASLVLSISDTGVGIPREKMNSIFDSFSQNNINNKRKFGGLGLGLYIVKTLVDMQNGTITLNSKVNEGTTFKIALNYPIVAMSSMPVAVIENEVQDLHGKNILVVEDNAINQLVIKMITKKWLNTAVVYTNNGQECLDAFKTEKFDIVLMDLQMPIMDGYEATIAIRNGAAGAENANIPIIAVTADVMETTKTRVQEIGMNKYLSKPIKNETLFQAIKDLV